MSREDRERDKRAVEIFMDTLDIGSPDEMSIEDKVSVLRGVCVFLLKELQKTYLYMERHSAGHDPFLHRDLGYVMDHSERLLNMFFPDFLKLESEEDEGEEEEDEHDDD